jgi:hypothetical protein
MPLTSLFWIAGRSPHLFMGVKIGRLELANISFKAGGEGSLRFRVCRIQLAGLQASEGLQCN